MSWESHCGNHFHRLCSLFTDMNTRMRSEMPQDSSRKRNDPQICIYCGSC